MWRASLEVVAVPYQLCQAWQGWPVDGEKQNGARQPFFSSAWATTGARLLVSEQKVPFKV